MTAADAPNRFEDSSRPLAGNNETQLLTLTILETPKTIRALLEKLQAQDPGLAPLSIIVRGPYAGGDLAAEISMSSSPQSDLDEVIDRRGNETEHRTPVMPDVRPV